MLSGNIYNNGNAYFDTSGLPFDVGWQWEDGARGFRTFVATLLGDCNQDGAVDFTDVFPFIQALTTTSFLVEADIDQSGEVTFEDIALFIAILADQ